MTPREWALLLTLSVFWSTSFFFIAVIVTQVPPITTALSRVVIASLVLLVFIHITGRRLPADPRAWRAFAGMSLLNNAVPFCLIAWAQTHITSGLASILNATSPLWTVIIAHFFTHDEKFNGSRVAGVLIGLMGVAWMTGGDAVRELGVNVTAQVAVLVASMLYAASAVYGRRFRSLGVDPLVTTTGVSMVTSAVLLPVSLIVDQPWTLNPGLPVAGAMLGLGVISTAISYGLYYRILATAGATNVLLVTLLVPVGAILLGTLILHERLEPKHLAGMALIAVGLATIDGRPLRWLVGRARAARQ